MSVAEDISLDEAVLCWRKSLQASGWYSSATVEKIRSIDAIGRVTAEPVYAVRSVPHYVCSAMDGFAFRSADAVGAKAANVLRLQVSPSRETLIAGTAMRVDTGDALPRGADSVVLKERVVLQNDLAEFLLPIQPGQHVRKIGEDILCGKKILPAWHRIGPADLGALLAAGADFVSVLKKPVITVIPTGNEIIDSPAELPPGFIRDINSPMLSALFTSWGARVLRHPIVPDDPAQLREAIRAALPESDIVVTNAGTSGGSEDFTGAVLGSLGEICCQAVAIRPGRPVVLATAGGKPLAGLPGYPVSCILTAELFLKDLVFQFQRQDPPLRRSLKATLASAVKSKPDVEEFLRVTLAQGTSYPVAKPLPRGASLISTLSQAHGWLRLAADCTEVAAGTVVDVEIFDI